VARGSQSGSPALGQNSPFVQGLAAFAPAELLNPAGRQRGGLDWRSRGPATIKLPKALETRSFDSGSGSHNGWSSRPITDLASADVRVWMVYGTRRRWRASSMLQPVVELRAVGWSSYIARSAEPGRSASHQPESKDACDLWIRPKRRGHRLAALGATICPRLNLSADGKRWAFSGRQMTSCATRAARRCSRPPRGESPIRWLSLTRAVSRVAIASSRVINRSLRRSRTGHLGTLAVGLYAEFPGPLANAGHDGKQARPPVRSLSMVDRMGRARAGITRCRRSELDVTVRALSASQRAGSNLLGRRWSSATNEQFAR